MKKQESLYPIPIDEMNIDFKKLGSFGDDSITFLKADYLNNLPDEDPAHFLMGLGAREYLADIQTLRRQYRAGIIAGSIILRSRIYSIGKNPHEFLANSPQEKIDWQGMSLARFALRQYFSFANEKDIIERLYEKVELPWFMHHSLYAAYDEGRPENDWVAVGIGDMLRVGDVAEAGLHEVGPREPAIEFLETEPLIAIYSHIHPQA